MSNILSDYPTPTSPARELDAIVPSGDGTETNRQHTSAGINVELSEDQPQQLEQGEAKVRSILIQDDADEPFTVVHLPTTPDGESSIQEQHDSPTDQPHIEPSMPHTSPLALQDRVDPHSSNWFQNMFDQLRDQHNDIRTLLEANNVFKAEEERLQELLTQVRSIVGPRISTWIDEDVAASMEAGKLVRRDLFVLDAEFNGSSDDDDDASKSKCGDSEEHNGDASRINSDRKGKGKANDNDGPALDSNDQGRTSDNATTSYVNYSATNDTQINFFFLVDLKPVQISASAL
jgi:hypothetical protein